MGYLVYGPGEKYEIDDRTLAHVRVAVVAKLRLQESFLLNWVLPVSEGSGRISLWLSPSIPLQFVFYGSKPVQINERWLLAMTYSSNSGRGMIVMAEKEADAFIDVVAPAAHGPVG
jgi:hypothetical protein